MTDVEKLKRELKILNQDHNWDELLTTTTKDILKELLPDLEVIIAPKQSDVKEKSKICPFPNHQLESEENCTLEQLERYRNIGLEEISKSRVGVLVLAGGEGSRLGVSYPKGTHNIGLPSQKSLFQLQAERIKKIEELANGGSIPWYIMTSDFTKTATETFFNSNDFFGIKRENVVFFNQGSLPVLDVNKRLVVENNQLMFAPDGNGGIFKALSNGLILEHMLARGVKHLYVYSVDNVLVKVCDPIFIGYCIDKRADCGAKTVRKFNPKEKIGVFCTIDCKIHVAEYSEIDYADADLHDDQGNLVFNAGNICNHYFTIEFLKEIVSNNKEVLKSHLVRTKTGGFKMEKFIFDAFKLSQNFVAWEVPRYKEFSALKNCDDIGTDCATTSKNDLYYLHKTYVEKAGGIVIGNVVEISPLVSYAGENLEKRVKDIEFQTPLYLN
ncbi:hypothetical protein RN001_011089 [Aquatica leii]|uniref:UDP-N-acetylglucosamine diphosphorylase n=1 Tax=Aquatica leii TaxID=1421715 RepID=A0AAN7QHX4_9COLE|nr:hypothetical protein RN001_011089 [Aquatica leii]